MTGTLKRRTKNVTQSHVALHLMINQLSVSMIPTAMRNESIIVNDVPTGMYVATDQHKLAAILGSVMNAMVSHSHNTSIHISAKYYGNVMLLHLKGNSKLAGASFKGSLDKIQELANNAGATVGITSYRNDITTVALSFVSAVPAA